MENQKTQQAESGSGRPVLHCDGCPRLLCTEGACANNSGPLCHCKECEGGSCAGIVCPVM